MGRRVVITGIGAVTGLGIGARALWDGLVAGRSAIAPVRAFDASGFPCNLAAEVRANDGVPFTARDLVPKSYRKAVKVMARDTELAVAAARLAVEDAGVITRGTAPEGSDAASTYPGERVGCQIGAGLIATEPLELAPALASARPPTEPPGGWQSAPGYGFDVRRWGTAPEEGGGVPSAGEATSGGDATSAGDATSGGGGMNNLQPLWLLKYLPNMLACHVTIIHGAEGPSNTITCAEASGLLSIAESARVIQRDAADACFSGGAESRVTPMGMLRLGLLGWLAGGDATATGDGAVRPFDPSATGTVVGEAGALLIVEALDKARARGARPYAEIAGFGAAQAPRREVGGSGESMALCIRRALDDAAIGPDEIDAIVPGGFGVPAMDSCERDGLARVLGARIGAIPAVLLAPRLGDTMAAASAVQAAAAALCLHERSLPAGSVRVGLSGAGSPGGSGPAMLRHVLVCAPSLGGQSAAMVLRAMDGRAC